MLLVLALPASSGCVSLPNIRACAIAGVVEAGADCAETLNPDYEGTLTQDEFIDFLLPQPERDDPENPGKRLPARGGAICSPADDWVKMKTALDKACHKLKCSRDEVEAIERLGSRFGVKQ